MLTPKEHIIQYLTFFSYNHGIKLTNQQQLIEIKRGSWGLGAFTTQRLQAKQLIGGK